MSALSTVALILLSKNHEKFVEECMDSVYRELGSTISIINLDFESTDGTVSKIKTFATNYSMNLHSESIEPKTGTLLAILNAPVHQEIEHVILLSADDALLPNYGAALRAIKLQGLPPKLLNFGLLIGEEIESAHKTKVPKWSKHSFVNSLLLSLGNPGTAPGSVLPWGLLREINADSFIRGNLIEDYLIWWLLQDKAEFINNKKPLVFYRQHANNLTKSRKNPDYAFSLGFNAGLPLQQKRSILKPLSVLLFAKCIRHVSISSVPDFVKGFLYSLNNKFL